MVLLPIQCFPSSSGPRCKAFGQYRILSCSLRHLQPFLQADPLASGGGGGVWGGAAGAGAGGFGAAGQAAGGGGGEDYDVVEITDDQTAAAPVPSGRVAQNVRSAVG